MSVAPRPSPLRIFISYGHDDYADVAVKLKDDLRAKGFEVWFDADRLDPGADWETSIEEGLNWVSKDDRGRIVLIMTPHAVRRPDGFCLNELARAVLKNLKIIPVMLVWCEPPLSICRVQWLDMTDCTPLKERVARYEAKLDMLVEVLQKDRIDFEGYQTHLSALLKPLSFDAEVKYNLDRFTGRAWLFEEVARWLADRDSSRVFWIMGGPGVGKTAISSWLCAHRPEIAALHFCRYDNVQKRDPRRAVMSIAYQLSTQLPDYEERLHRVNMDDLQGLDARTLFDKLIVQPFNANYPAPEKDIVVLIDALDEATIDGRNELADLISVSVRQTPRWLRLIVTSRPSPEVMVPLQAYSPFMIDIADPRNNEDVRAYLARELGQAKGDVKTRQIEAIVKKSGGLFIYAEWIVNEIKAGRLSLDKPETFPQGLAGIFVKIFERQFPDVKLWERDIAPALEVVAAAQEPLSLESVAAIFGWGGRDKRRFQHELEPLFSFDHGIRPFHKTVMDWLMDEAKKDPYYVDRGEGNKRLTEYLWQEYKNNAWSHYLVSYLPQHLLGMQRWKELEALLLDMKFITDAVETDKWLLLSQLIAINAQSPLKLKNVYGTGFPLDGNDKKGLLAIAEILIRLAHFDEGERILDYLIPLYRQSSDQISLLQALDIMWYGRTMRAHYDKALVLAQEQEDVSRKINDKKMLVTALTRKSMIYTLMYDNNRAMGPAEEAEQLAREIGDEYGIATSFRTQGMLRRMGPDFDRSLFFFSEEERIDRAMGRIDLLATCLNYQGLVNRRKGDYKAALAKFEEATSICRKIGLINIHCFVLGWQGQVYEAMGRLDDAMSLFKEGAKLAIEANQKVMLSLNLTGQGRVLYKKNRLDEAEALLRKSMEVAKEIGDIWNVQYPLGALAVVLAMKGDQEGAREAFDRQEKICREKDFWFDLQECLEQRTLLLKG